MVLAGLVLMKGFTYRNSLGNTVLHTISNLPALRWRRHASFLISLQIKNQSTSGKNKAKTMTLNSKTKEMCGASCSSGMSVLGVGCVARVAAPHLGLSRVRLSVTEPRFCCFPGLRKRREVASFSFRKEDWTKVLDGEYENTAAYSLVDLDGLQRLHEELPVKVKWWAGRRKGKTRLDGSLGDVLSLLRSCPHVSLQVVARSEQVSVSWAATHNDGTLKAQATSSQNDDQDPQDPITEYCTFVNHTTGRIITLPAHDQSASYSFPGAWTSEDDQLDEEDLKLISALGGGASSLTDTCKGAIQRQAFHTYINHATGRILTLPAHEQVGDGWTFPGAWTSQDDRLDEEDVKLLNALASSC